MAAVLLLVCCGCVGLAAIGSMAGDSYGDPDESDTGDGGLPTAAPVPSPATTPSAGPGRLKVVYEVTGTGPVDIQFYDANADFLQLDEVPSPWRLAFTASDRHRVQIIATPADAADEAACRITINGKVVSQDSGSYGATCFGW